MGDSKHGRPILEPVDLEAFPTSSHLLSGVVGIFDATIYGNKHQSSLDGVDSGIWAH